MKIFDDGLIDDIAYTLYLKGYQVDWIDAESFLVAGEYNNYRISVPERQTNICIWLVSEHEGYIFKSIVRAITFLLGKEKGE